MTLASCLHCPSCYSARNLSFFFFATRQLLSDTEKLRCGCHTRAPKPTSVSCVCRGAEARISFLYLIDPCQQTLGNANVQAMFGWSCCHRFGASDLFIHTHPEPDLSMKAFHWIFYTFSFSSNTATYQVAGKCAWNVWICSWWNAFWFWGVPCSRRTTVKLQIFVRYPFSYFWLETGPYKLIFVLSRPQNKITLKFDGLKTKINFHLVLNFALFSRVRMYEIKYRTKICDFTVSLYTSTTMEKEKKEKKELWRIRILWYRGIKLLDSASNCKRMRLLRLHTPLQQRQIRL